MSTTEEKVADAASLAPKDLSLKTIKAFVDRMDDDIENSRANRETEVLAQLVKTRAHWIKLRNKKEAEQGIEPAPASEEEEVDEPPKAKSKPKVKAKHKPKAKAKSQPRTPVSSSESESEAESPPPVRLKPKPAKTRRAKTESEEPASPKAPPAEKAKPEKVEEKPKGGGWLGRNGYFTPTPR